MANKEQVIKEVRAALERETRINVHSNPIEVDYEDSTGALTVSGEVEDVRSKKLGLELAAAVYGVSGIVDRIRVRAPEAMEDDALAELVFNAMVQEPAFSDFTIRVRGGNGDIRRFQTTPREENGTIDIEVRGGVVTLNGKVESYSHKALAGVLAWWKRGTRDVVNGLDVAHPTEDPRGEMADALRLVLEKDYFVNASQIKIVCHDSTVELEGVVPKPAEREMAESDAWCLFGVDRVINRLEVLET